MVTSRHMKCLRCLILPKSSWIASLSCGGKSVAKTCLRAAVGYVFDPELAVCVIRRHVATRPPTPTRRRTQRTPNRSRTTEEGRDRRRAGAGNGKGGACWRGGRGSESSDRIAQSTKLHPPSLARDPSSSDRKPDSVCSIPIIEKHAPIGENIAGNQACPEDEQDMTTNPV